MVFLERAIKRLQQRQAAAEDATNELCEMDIPMESSRYGARSTMLERRVKTLSLLRKVITLGLVK